MSDLVFCRVTPVFQVFAGLICAFLTCVEWRVSASVILTNSDPAVLRGAVEQGGNIRLDFDGVVLLTDTLAVTKDTALDATGRAVRLDGGNLVRHFTVTNGVTLRLNGLELSNGRYLGARGDMGENGNPAWGGSIFNSGGIVELVGCRFMSNQVVAGDGGEIIIRPLPQGPTKGGHAYGGAIYSTNGDLRITNSVFTGNSCTGGQGNALVYTSAGGDASGGGIYCTNGAMSLVSVVFTNNLVQAGERGGTRALVEGSGRAFGGALADCAATSRISGCVFGGNHALGATAYSGSSGTAHGGALFHASGAAIIDRTLFTTNVANGLKGGMAAPGAGFLIAASGYGGAIYNQSGVLTIENSALVLNQARGGDQVGGGFFPLATGGSGGGGAIWSVDPAVLNLSNCTLAHNSAQGGSGVAAGSAGGGAIGGPVTLVNVTLAMNSARLGAGDTSLSDMLPPVVWGSSLHGATTLTNTILYCAPGETNVSGTITDGGHNLSSDGSAGFVLPTSRNDLDPLLAPLADNGGVTPTMALLPASPAIDAGDDSACPPTDQRGVPRPKGLACDIGAFELTPKLAVSRGSAGMIALEQVFQAGRTNRVLASTNLLDWVELEPRMADPNGVTRLEEVNPTAVPFRFYRLGRALGQE